MHDQCEVLDTSAFYSASYDFTQSFILRPGELKILGPNTNRVCRFCGRDESAASFKKRAHAIPEACGNKSLFTNWECDDCNRNFGTSIENDLAAFLTPARTFSRISGKNGVPSIKQHGTAVNRWRIDVKQGVIAIRDFEEDPMIEMEWGKKQIKLEVLRDAYTPIAVSKAFVRIGLTLLPPDDLEDFQHALNWIVNPDHDAPGPRRIPAFCAFQPGPMRNDIMSAIVLRRKSADLPLPYAFVVLAFGNYQYQVCLPSETKDIHVMGSKFVNLPAFPMVSFSTDFAKYGYPVLNSLNLYETTRLKSVKVRVTLKYDRIERIHQKNKELQHN